MVPILHTLFVIFSDLRVYLPMDAIVNGKTPGTGTTASIATWANPAFGKSTSIRTQHLWTFCLFSKNYQTISARTVLKFSVSNSRPMVWFGLLEFILKDRGREL